jgi:uncharacterized Tic20 family protein
MLLCRIDLLCTVCAEKTEVKLSAQNYKKADGVVINLQKKSVLNFQLSYVTT